MVSAVRPFRISSPIISKPTEQGTLPGVEVVGDGDW